MTSPDRMSVRILASAASRIPVPERLARFMTDVECVVFSSHAVADVPPSHLRWIVPCKTAARFEADLRWLQRRYRFVGYHDVGACLAGTRPLPRHAALLTFDDGYAEVYSIVRPLLERLGIPALAFLTTSQLDNGTLSEDCKASLAVTAFLALDRTGRGAIAQPLGLPDLSNGRSPEAGHAMRDFLRTHEEATQALWQALALDEKRYLCDNAPYLTSEHVREMAADGWAFGAHGVVHRHTQDLGYNDLEAEIVESCEAVARLTGQSQAPFAFPYTGEGVRRDWLARIRREHGAVGLFFDVWGLKREDALVWHRVDIDDPDEPIGAALRRAHLVSLVREGPRGRPKRHVTAHPCGAATGPQYPQTAGQLPCEPFRHLEPTAVGLLDLEAGWTPTRPGGRYGQARDAMFLVRLHGEPLGILYLPDGAQWAGPTLRELVWSQLGDAIRLHVSRAGCGPHPDNAEDLDRLLVRTPDCRLSRSKTPAASVAVIVPTTGCGGQLASCLAALADLDGPEYEVLVVDNRPGIGDTKRVVEGARAGSRHSVRYLEEPRPGSAVSRNRGASQTDADILAFTDDDVVVDHGWLRWLVDPFTTDAVGATTGLVFPRELETPAQKLFELYSGFSLGLARRPYDLVSFRADDRLLYPFWGGMFGSGASMAFRRRRFLAAGGFDPALRTGQDIDALSAVVLRGERLVYEPRSLCWHANHRDEAALRRQLLNYGAGFTAVLTKASLHDRRFFAAAARSVPTALRLGRRHLARSRTTEPVLPARLARLEKVGMLWGPARYALGAAAARRLDLRQAIRGD